MRLTALLLVPAAALVLAGCGLRGPLYLPEKSGAVVTAPAATPTAPPAPSAPTQAEPAPPASAAPAPQKKTDEDQDSQSPP